MREGGGGGGHKGAVGRGQGEVSNAPQIFAELEAQFVKTSLPVIF